MSPAEIKAMRLLLQKDILGRLSRQPATRKKELYQHVLIRAASPEDNAQMEINWHLCMAEIGGNALQKVLLEALLLMEADSRVKRYRDPDAVMQTIHIQMRTNTALAEGDTALAERVLCQFIDPAAPQSAGLAHAA